MIRYYTNVYIVRSLVGAGGMFYSLRNYQLEPKHTLSTGRNCVPRRAATTQKWRHLAYRTSLHLLRWSKVARMCQTKSRCLCQRKNVHITLSFLHCVFFLSKSRGVLFHRIRECHGVDKQRDSDSSSSAVHRGPRRQEDGCDVSVSVWQAIPALRRKARLQCWQVQWWGACAGRVGMSCISSPLATYLPLCVH